MSPQAFPKFESIQRIHIVGVCGTLMGAFAAYLKRHGIQVSGSDENVYPPMSDVLRNAGVKIFEGYRAENLRSVSPRPELVVIGNVIRRDNPEAVEALSGGYLYCSLPEFMENTLLRETKNLVVAGTHGKTTTSSMLAHVLSHAGRDPSYFIGGVSKNLPNSFHVGALRKDSEFVLEGDEYDTVFWDKVPKFNHYLPDHAILTSVEYDHADIYPDFESVIRAFEGLVDRIRPDGHLIACLDYPVSKRLIERFEKRGVGKLLTYGSHPVTLARFVPSQIQTKDGVTRFEVLDQGKSVASLEIQMAGNHNVLNALAVWIECHQLGLYDEEIKKGLKSFEGVKRRQEVRGVVNEITVIDDFAHHPTAVRETLIGFRALYPGKRIVTVFEPRSATSRRKVFQKDYAKAFMGADVVLIANPYDQSRIVEGERFSSEELVNELRSKGKAAHVFASVEEGVVETARLAQPGDLVAVLSNGGFGGFIPKLLEALKK